MVRWTTFRVILYAFCEIQLKLIGIFVESGLGLGARHNVHTAVVETQIRKSQVTFKPEQGLCRC